MISTKRRTNPELRAAMGRKIRARRLELDLNHRQMEARTGLSDAFQCRVERGLCGMTVDSLLAIARALDVKPGWFFEEVG